MKLLSTRAVAEELALSPLTIIRLADSGALPSIVLARRKNRRLIRFDPEAIQKFIAARTTGGAK